MISDDLKAEARAFDDRISERIRNGHIPDLRRVEPCDWFFNNPWRRPYTADMDFGRAFRFALSHAQKGELMEVGAGAGHMSLEFARNGFHVTGLDAAADCLGVARRMADENPYHDGFGSLRYLEADFLQWQSDRTFDTVCFFGCLHHFSQVDAVVQKAFEILRPGGRLIVCEPARDWTTASNGVMLALLRILLSQRGLWYDPQPLPASLEDLRRYSAVCLSEIRDGHDAGEGRQSPHDNSSAAEDMLVSLRARFTELECQRLNGFLQRMIGGVRGQDEAENLKLAQTMDYFDKLAIETGMIQPSEMYWAGQKP